MASKKELKEEIDVLKDDVKRLLRIEEEYSSITNKFDSLDSRVSILDDEILKLDDEFQSVAGENFKNVIDTIDKLREGVDSTQRDLRQETATEISNVYRKIEDESRNIRSQIDFESASLSRNNEALTKEIEELKTKNKIQLFSLITVGIILVGLSIFKIFFM